jgi:hypothetical protein
MPNLRRLNLPVWLFLGLPLAAALLVGGWNHTQWSRSQASCRLEEGWDLPQVLDHLHSQGLLLRVVSAERDGVVRHSAFLTRTDKTWDDLTSLPKTVEHVGRWEGTVYCERINPRASRSEQVRFWGAHCLDAGSFVFFGDRKLLDKIGAALRARFN